MGAAYANIYYVVWALLVLALGAMVIARLSGASPRATRVVMIIGVVVLVSALAAWIVQMNLSMNR